VRISFTQETSGTECGKDSGSSGGAMYEGDWKDRKQVIERVEE